MSKKIYTISVLVISFFLIVLLVIGFIIKLGLIPTNNVYNTDSLDNNQDGLSYPTFGAFLQKDANTILQYFDEKCSDNEYYDIYVKYNSISTSKKVSGFDVCQDLYEKKDKHGKITNNYTYAVCDVSFLNKSDKDCYIYLNCVNLAFEDTHEYLYSPRSFNSGGKSQPGSKSYFKVKLKQGKEENFKIVFIVADNDLAQIKKQSLILVALAYIPPDASIPIISK